MRSSGIRARRLFVGPIVVMLASCSLVESLDDLTSGDCEGDACIDAGATSTDAETSEDAGTLPTDDAESPSDAGDAADSSSIDATDDADAAPECPTLPTGWTSVRIAAEDAGCASGFKRTLIDNPRSASDACACSCQAAPSNPCEYDNGSYGFGFGIYGSGCNYSGNILTLGCQKNPSWNTSINSVSGTPRPPVNVTCPATAKRPALVDDDALDVCASPAGAKTCGEGACILHEGTDAACLDGFPVRRELTDQADVEDTRACGSCSCQTKATSCVDASFTLYTDDQCSAGSRTAVFDNTCRPFDSNFSPKSYQYRATPNVSGCEPASPTTPFTGSVTSKKRVTLCCAEP